MWKMRLTEVEKPPATHMLIREEGLEFIQVQLAIKLELPSPTPHLMMLS